MRLNTKNRGKPVVPVCSIAILGLAMLGLLISPGLNAFAENSCSNTGTASSNAQCNLNATASFTVLPSQVTDFKNGEFSFEVIGDKLEQNNAQFEFNVAEYLEMKFVNDANPNNGDVHMTTSGTGTADVVPNGGKQIAYGTTKFEVASNNAKGFTVSLKATDNTKTSLAGADTNNNYTIDPTAGVTGRDNLAAKTWGYNVTATATGISDVFDVLDTDAVNGTYHGLGTGVTQIYSRTTPSAGSQITLTCASAVDANTPSDTYSTGLTLSAVAPAEAVAGLTHIVVPSP